jgi:hypothetical protein
MRWWEWKDRDEEIAGQQASTYKYRAGDAVAGQKGSDTAVSSEPELELEANHRVFDRGTQGPSSRRRMVTDFGPRP